MPHQLIVLPDDTAKPLVDAINGDAPVKLRVGTNEEVGWADEEPPEPPRAPPRNER